MKKFLILGCVLMISCRESTQRNVQINNDSSYGLGEWIDEKRVKEIYLYRLGNNKESSRVERIFMGNPTSAEAGLGNFPSSDKFFLRASEAGLENALLIHYEAPLSRDTEFTKSRNLGHRQEMILFGSGNPFKYGNFLLEDFDEFFTRLEVD